MIHTCNVQCYSIDPETTDALGLKENTIWLPFAFHMDIVLAIKKTTDDPDEPSYNCTTIFTELNDTYVLDTPYDQFLPLFVRHNGDDASSVEPTKSDEPNL